MVPWFNNECRSWSNWCRGQIYVSIWQGKNKFIFGSADPVWCTAENIVLVCDAPSVWLKFSGGAGVVTPLKPPPLYEQLLPLPTPCFKMFLERSLNDPPPPTTPLQAPFTATPLPIHHSFSPPKNFDHTPTCDNKELYSFKDDIIDKVDLLI